MEFGEFLRKRRKVRGIKRIHLEKRLKMKPGNLYGYESGRCSTRALTFQQLFDLSDELRVEFLRLCAFSPHHMPPLLSNLILEYDGFLTEMLQLVDKYQRTDVS